VSRMLFGHLLPSFDIGVMNGKFSFKMQCATSGILLVERFILYS